MVRDALMLPNRAVQQVAREQGEASIEAAREAFGEAELDRLERRCLAGREDEVVVLAALHRTERERTEEAAEEAGEHPAVWLADKTVEAARDSGVSAGDAPVSSYVEQAIFHGTEV